MPDDSLNIMVITMQAIGNVDSAEYYLRKNSTAAPNRLYPN